MALAFDVQEHLKNLTPEQLDALEQALTKLQATDNSANSAPVREAELVEPESRGSILRRGVLRGLSAMSEGALLGLQGRPISEASFLKPQPRDEIKDYLRKKQIDESFRKDEIKDTAWKPQTKEEAIEFEKEKQAIKKPEEQVFTLNSDASIPSGYEAIGFDQKGNPMIRKIKKESVAEKKFNVTQEEKEELKIINAENIKDQTLDALDTIANVEKRINSFGVFGGLPSIPGTERTTWEANVDKLLAGKIINLMMEMKRASRTGATGFGQLNKEELEVLKNASTALKRNLPPKDAQIILNEMKVKLNKILDNNTQQPSGDLVTIEDNMGKTIQIPRSEAIKKGYING